MAASTRAARRGSERGLMGHWRQDGTCPPARSEARCGRRPSQDLLYPVPLVDVRACLRLVADGVERDGPPQVLDPDAAVPARRPEEQGIDLRPERQRDRLREAV